MAALFKKPPVGPKHGFKIFPMEPRLTKRSKYDEGAHQAVEPRRNPFKKNDYYRIPHCRFLSFENNARSKFVTEPTSEKEIDLKTKPDKIPKVPVPPPPAPVIFDPNPEEEEMWGDHFAAFNWPKSPKLSPIKSQFIENVNSEVPIPDSIPKKPFYPNTFSKESYPLPFPQENISEKLPKNPIRD